MPKIHTLETKEQFIDLRAKGHSFNQIADQLGVSKPTLIEWSRELQIDIENRRTLEMEALQEKYLVSWEQKMEFIGNEYERLTEELKQRDFSDMTTKEIYELLFKVQGQMKSMESKPRLKRKKDEIEFDFTQVDSWEV